MLDYLQMWRIDDYKSKYKTSILELFRVNYPGSVLTGESFFEWQNFANPAGRSIIKLAVNEKKEVVGYYCISPQKYLIDEKVVLGSISLNTLVRTDYRGKGIFTKLALAAFEEAKRRKIKFTLGFPNQNSYHGFVTKLEFTDMGEMPLLIKPVNLINLVAYKLGLKKSVDHHQSKEMEINSKDIEKLVKKGTGGTGNRVWRYKDFWQWRLNWPERNYKIVVNAQGRGWAVVRTMEIEGLKNGLIIDFKADRNLKGEIGEYFKKEKVDQIGGLFVSNSDEIKMLKKWGYIECPNFLKPQPMRPVIKWHEGKVPRGFYDLANWQLTMLDYDVG